jgi:hypothetical protein
MDEYQAFNLMSCGEVMESSSPDGGDDSARGCYYIPLWSLSGSVNHLNALVTSEGITCL